MTYSYIGGQTGKSYIVVFYRLQPLTHLYVLMCNIYSINITYSKVNNTSNI